MSSVVSPYTLKADNPHSTLPRHDFITFGSKTSLGPGSDGLKATADTRGISTSLAEERSRSARTSKEATRAPGLTSRGARLAAGSHDI